MKRKTNKIFVLLAIIMLITMCFAFGASAETWRDYEYTVLEDGTVEITAYNGTETDVVIPSDIDGKTVTSIGNYTFDGSEIKTIEINKNIKSIGYRALTCSTFENISVSSDNEYYSSEDGVLFNKDKTILIQYPIGNKRTSYSIPDGVTVVGENSFAVGYEFTSNLIEIIIPDTVKTIEKLAFAQSVKLKKITFGKGLEIIDDNAFTCCFSLKEVTFPESLKSIGWGAFYMCLSLKEVVIHENIVLLEKGAFDQCIGLQEIYILGDTEISEQAFRIAPIAKVYIFGKNNKIGEEALCLSSIVFSGDEPETIANKLTECFLAIYAEKDEAKANQLMNEIAPYVMNHDTLQPVGAIYLHDDGESYIAEAYAKENGVKLVRYHDFEASEWVYDWDNLIRTRKCSFEGCDAIESEPLNETDKPVEPTPEEKCDCLCHSDGTFIRSLIAWVYKFVMGVLGINRTCVCGVTHY